MSLPAVSAATPLAQLSSFQSTNVADLYPKEIIDAIGGVHATQNIREIEEYRRPDHGVNLHGYWKSLPETDKPFLIRGVDLSESPFILIVVPGYQPQVLHPFSRYTKREDYIDITKWRLSQGDNLPPHKLQLNEDDFGRIWTDNCLEILGQITRGEDCRETMKALYRS